MKAVAERSTVKSCPTVKSRSSVERAAAKSAAAAKSRSAPEAAPTVKPVAAVEATPAVKSSTAMETAPTMKPASATVESSASMAAAALSECRRGRTKNHERRNCNENYWQGLLHFSPSDPTTRDRRAGTNFRRGHLRWQPTYRPILHPRCASSHKPENGK